MSVLLFDVDNTLYSRHLGVVPRVDQRINEFLLQRMGLPAAEVDPLRCRYWTEYGNTLRGLMIHHQVEPKEYLDFVHDLDLSDSLRPDRELGRILDRLPERKAIFTNASRAHAAQVLRLLGLERAFEAVFALEDFRYIPKPHLEAYRTVLERLDVEGWQCSLVDDTRDNLVTAKTLGMRTIWVSEGSPGDPFVDHVIPAVHELESIRT